MRLLRPSFTSTLPVLLSLAWNTRHTCSQSTTSHPTTHCTEPRAVWAPTHTTLENKLYIQGGQSQDLSYLGQFYALDLATPWNSSCPAWMALPDGPVNFYHSSAPVFPGPSSDGDKSKGAILTFKAPVDSPSLIHRYDVVARTWTNSSVQVLVPRRYGIDAVTDPHSGLVYLLGGYNTWLLDHMAVYDPHLDTLSSEALSNEKGSDQAQILGLAFYSAAWVPSLDQIIYVGGNSDNFPNKTTATIELYSPEKDQWTSVITTGDVPQSIDSACLVIDEARRQAVLFGGSGQAHDSNQIFFLDLNPESDSVFRWTQGQPARQSRSNMACAAHGGYFIAWGGKVNNTIGEHQAPVIYDIITKQWVDKYNPLA